MATIAAAILAVTSAQQSYAQYGGGDSSGSASTTTNGGGGGGVLVNSETLQKCKDLRIPTNQCNEVTVLQAERIQIASQSQVKGSGTSMLATELGQMVIFVGVLGAIFGGVAGAFYIMGRNTKRVSA